MQRLPSFVIFLLSLIPIFENKGAIIVAAAARIPWKMCLIMSSTGAVLPIPFILFFTEGRINALRKYSASRKFLESVDKFTEKHGTFFRKYSYFALALIISIPFTGMGSWAGALLSNLMGLRKKYSAIAIAAGILISGLITILMAYGLLSLISSQMNAAAMMYLGR